MKGSAEDVRDSLREIAEAVEIVSKGEYRMHDQIIDIRDLPPPTGRQARKGGSPMWTPLRNAIYRRFYNGIIETAVAEGDGAENESGSVSHLLVEANGGQTIWDEGWKTISRMSDGRIVAAKDSRVRTWAPGQYINDARPHAPGKGDVVRALNMTESSATQPGFHFFFGDAVADDVDRASQVRFYWNVNWEGAIKLVGLLGRVLNRWRIAYQFKCPVRKPHYVRRDSGVLYVGGRRAAFLRELLPAIFEEMDGRLHDAPPLFTRRIARGVGVAENPEGGDSFGMDRCGIVADGVIDAYASQGDAVARLAAMEARFEQRGISLEEPWLNRRGVDPHGLGDWTP